MSSGPGSAGMKRAMGHVHLLIYISMVVAVSIILTIVACKVLDEYRKNTSDRVTRPLLSCSSLCGGKVDTHGIPASSGYGTFELSEKQEGEAEQLLLKDKV